MKIFIPYQPPNWNEYINIERANIYAANKIKQEEKDIVRLFAKEKYTGKYPVQITFRPHFKDKRNDLDNTRIKGLLDGLVSAGIIKNDNLNHIQRLVYEPVFGDDEGIEIVIEQKKIKPIEKYPFAFCPVCKEHCVKAYEIHDNFCANCGQELDWGDL